MGASRLRFPAATGLVVVLGSLLLLGCVDQPAEVSQRITKPLKHPSGYVALSYDDGPTPELTPELLDALKANRAHATFFVMGDRAEISPDLVQREVAEGHVVGNHTWNHPALVGMPDDEVTGEVETTSALLKELGATVDLFRPPYDSHDPRIDELVQDEVLTTAAWTYARDPRDWDHPSELGKPAAEVCSFVAEKSQAGDVVLLHDKLAGTVEATSCIIAGLRARGLEPGRMLPAQGPSPQNGGTWIKVVR